MLGTLIQAVYTYLWCVLNEQFQQLVLDSKVCSNACKELNWKIISRVLFLFESFHQTCLADIATNHCNFKYHFDDLKLRLVLKRCLSHLRLSLDFIALVFSNSDSFISENFIHDSLWDCRRCRVYLFGLDNYFYFFISFC